MSLCKLCYEPNAIRRQCCRSLFCDYCYVKLDFCPHCKAETKAEAKTGATFQVKVLSEHEECRRCLDPGLIRRCCGRYYCDNCYYSAPACRSCGYPIDKNERNELWKNSLYGKGIVGLKKLRGLFGSIYSLLSWVLTLVITGAFISLIIIAILIDVKKPTGIYGYSCYGFFRTCDVTLCVDMSASSAIEYTSLPPLSSFKTCSIDSTHKLQSKGCIYDRELYHLSGRQMGYDICSETFNEGIYVFEDTFEQWGLLGSGQTLSDDEELTLTSQPTLPKTLMKSAHWAMVQGGWSTNYCGYSTSDQDRIRHAERKYFFQSENSTEDSSIYDDIINTKGRALSFRGNQPRILETQGVDVPYGGTVEVDLFVSPPGYDTNPLFEKCKSSYQGTIVAQYSIDGGANWEWLTEFSPGLYGSTEFQYIKIDLPRHSWSNNTKIKFYQPHYEGMRDSWAVDNFRILKKFPESWKKNSFFKNSMETSKKKIRLAQCCLETDWCVERLSPSERIEKCRKNFPWYRSNFIEYFTHPSFQSLRNEYEEIYSSSSILKNYTALSIRKTGYSLRGSDSLKDNEVMMEQISNRIDQVDNIPLEVFQYLYSFNNSQVNDYKIGNPIDIDINLNSFIIDSEFSEKDLLLQGVYKLRVVEIALLIITFVSYFDLLLITFVYYINNKEFYFQNQISTVISKFLKAFCHVKQKNNNKSADNQDNLAEIDKNYNKWYRKLWRYLIPLSWRVNLMYYNETSDDVEEYIKKIKKVKIANNDNLASISAYNGESTQKLCGIDIDWWIYWFQKHWTEPIHKSARLEANFKSLFADKEGKGKILNKKDDIEVVKKNYQSKLKKQQKKLEERKKVKRFKESQVEDINDSNIENKLNEDFVDSEDNTMADPIQIENKSVFSSFGFAPGSKPSNTQSLVKQTMFKEQELLRKKEEEEEEKNKVIESKKISKKKFNKKNKVIPIVAYEKKLQFVFPTDDPNDQVKSLNQETDNEISVSQHENYISQIQTIEFDENNGPILFKTEDLIDEKEKIKRQNLSLLRTPFNFLYDSNLCKTFGISLLIIFFSLFGYLYFGLYPQFKFVQYLPHSFLNEFYDKNIYFKMDSRLFLFICVFLNDFYAIYIVITENVPLFSSFLPSLTIDLSEDMRTFLIGKTSFPLGDINEIQVLTSKKLKFFLFLYFFQCLPWCTILLILRETIYNYSVRNYIFFLILFFIFSRNLKNTNFMIQLYLFSFYFFTTDLYVRDNLGSVLKSNENIYIIGLYIVYFYFLMAVLCCFFDTRYFAFCLLLSVIFGVFYGIFYNLFKQFPTSPIIFLPTVQRSCLCFYGKRKITSSFFGTFIPTLKDISMSSHYSYIVLPTDDDLKVSFLLNHGIEEQQNKGDIKLAAGGVQ